MLSRASVAFKSSRRCLNRMVHSIPDGPKKKMNLLQSITDAMRIFMEKDPNSILLGEDVGFGGVFRCTLGLQKQFGDERVFNTPLSEQGLVGFAIGYASTGRPVIAEIQFCDYIFPAFDQIVNEAAKYRYRSGNNYNCGGLTIRAPCGAIGHGGHYHSQSVEGYFAHTPGLKIVVPHNPVQAKGLLLSALRDPNPVLYFEPKALYRAAVDQVPTDDYMLPLEKADIVKEGKDVTIITYGKQVNVCKEAIEMAEKQNGINCELIDLQTILPWDRDTIFNSVCKTGRCIISHEAQVSFGVAAELTAEIQKNCFLNLEAPIVRVCGADTPVPLALEKYFLPNKTRVYDAIVDTMNY